MTESKLTKKAKELKLTARQRLFCEALAADPTRNQVRAAQSAGYGKGADVRAAEMAANSRIQEYFQAIVGEAIEGAANGAVMDAREGLEILTKQARMLYPWEAHRKNGKVYKPGLAVSRILDHYDGTGKGGDSKTLVFNIDLSKVPVADLKAGVLGLLGQGSGRNGSDGAGR